MVPTPLLRFHQRIDVVAHKNEIRAAFDAYQYCACMPGGTENMSWLARVCWDQGIPFLMADVPNGFPGAKLSEVYEAVQEVLPVMVPSFLRWCENGYRAYNQDGDLMDEVVGGMPQGDPLIPIFFGALMVHKMKLTEAALKDTDGEAYGAKKQALALFYADDGLITHPEPAQMEHELGGAAYCSLHKSAPSPVGSTSSWHHSSTLRPLSPPRTAPGPF